MSDINSIIANMPTFMLIIIYNYAKSINDFTLFIKNESFSFGVESGGKIIFSKSNNRIYQSILESFNEICEGYTQIRYRQSIRYMSLKGDQCGAFVRKFVPNFIRSMVVHQNHLYVLFDENIGVYDLDLKHAKFLFSTDFISNYPNRDKFHCGTIDTKRNIFIVRDARHDYQLFMFSLNDSNLGEKVKTMILPAFTHECKAFETNETFAKGEILEIIYEEAKDEIIYIEKRCRSEDPHVLVRICASSSEADLVSRFNINTEYLEFFRGFTYQKKENTFIVLTSSRILFFDINGCLECEHVLSSDLHGLCLLEDNNFPRLLAFGNNNADLLCTEI